MPARLDTGASISIIYTLSLRVGYILLRTVVCRTHDPKSFLWFLACLVDRHSYVQLCGTSTTKKSTYGVAVWVL